MKHTILSLSHVSFTYPGNLTPVLSDISLSVKEGEIVLLCGASGCGKSTLLSHMKKNQIPFGKGIGDIVFDGTAIEEMSDFDSAREIGFVGQDPDSSIVTDQVWHELAFGLENLGVPTDEIRQRIAEISEYCGITSWFNKNIDELSGGQKQILNLASVLVMRPRLIILDEPTSQMDPIGVRRFVDLIVRLNRELGITIILCEQHLEEILPIADSLLIMDQGKLLAYGPVSMAHKLMQSCRDKTKKPLAVEGAMPSALQVFIGHPFPKEASASPWSIRMGRNLLKTYAPSATDMGSSPRPVRTAEKKADATLVAKDLCFSYQKDLPILSHLSLTLHKGECYGLLGGNGSGKSTALKVIAGILKKKKGKVLSDQTIFYLPQNPKDLFTEVTVEDELAEAFWGHTMSDSKKEERVFDMLQQMELTSYKDSNPMDLSGGQRQRLALGKLLLLKPDILLLDEPTKGLDSLFKDKLISLLKDLLNKQMTLLLVSHDLEFAARVCDRVGLLFQGQITSEGTVREFFTENSFYTTGARRMSQNILPDCILPEDILNRLSGGGEHEII